MIADSYNDYLREKLEELFGKDECMRFMEESEKPRPTVIRTNLSKIKRKDLLKLLNKRGMELQALDWNNESVVVFKSPVPVGATPEYLCGLYTVQGASSLLPVLNLDLQVRNMKCFDDKSKSQDTMKLENISKSQNVKENKTSSKSQNTSENETGSKSQDSINLENQSKDGVETKEILVSQEIDKSKIDEIKASHSESTENNSVHLNNAITEAIQPLKDESLKDNQKKPERLEENNLLDGIKKDESFKETKKNSKKKFKLNQKTQEVDRKITVLDMCAAPGGKTTHISTIIGDSGVVYAYDICKERCKAIQSNLMRLGLSNTLVIAQDVRELKMPNFFDRILLDAPCSGTGVISKDPDVKINRSFQDIDKTVRIQKELIMKAFVSLKFGGVLVYSTCSVLVDENEAVVDYLLKKNIGAKLVETDTAVGINGMKRFREHIFHPTMKLTKRIYPQVHNMDGFFVAKIIKNKI